MKIEKLTDNKIRIILNIDDLAKKNIDINSLIKNNDLSQKLFKNILKQAEKEVGFDVQDSKLLIEAFISAEGFFIITFTKLSEELKIEKNLNIRPKPRRKNYNPTSSTAIYVFENFDEFENFCTYLKNYNITDFKKMAKKIALYEYKFKYFLVFSEIDIKCDLTNFIYTSISEFAKLSSTSKNFESRISEFGKIIFKNDAIKNGINFFAKA